MVGSAWMPCERPIVGVNLYSRARRSSAALRFSTSAIEEIGGANQLHVEAGVEHVGRRHALMHKARFRPDDLRQMGEEGDDVVLGLALDLLDARNVELGVLALGPDLLRRVLRDDAELGHGVGGMRLDLEPDAKARLRRPDRRHFRPAVARYHRHLSGRLRCSRSRDSSTIVPRRAMLANRQRIANDHWGQP